MQRRIFREPVRPSCRSHLGVKRVSSLNSPVLSQESALEAWDSPLLSPFSTMVSWSWVAFLLPTLDRVHLRLGALSFSIALVLRSKHGREGTSTVRGT